jgi:metallo-beta-lactamase class B
VSTIFKTNDGGAPHIASLKRWRTLAQAAGVDTLIGNHQTQDGAVENLELLKIRRGDDPNPFVLGTAAYLRYIDVNTECTYANMARNGQKIE